MPEAALANVAQNVHGQLRAEGYVLLIEDESSGKFSVVNVPGQGSKHVSPKFRVWRRRVLEWKRKLKRLPYRGV